MPIRKAMRRVASGVRRRVGVAVQRVGDRVFGAEEPRPEPASWSPAPPEPELKPAPVAAATETVGAPLLTREQIQQLFEDMVRPALQSDGGDITLVEVKDNDVYVELVGACQTCPSSLITMHQGIERLLQEEYPQFGRLIRVNG